MRLRIAGRVEPGMSALLLGLFLAGLMLLLFGAYSTFTHTKWAIYDYGVYTNMIYNTGRGDWFRFLVDRNYLHVHLSFSLALLGPLFRVWDSPLVLMVAQWAAFCGGCLCVLLACRRHGLSRVVILAVLVVYTLWPFTQSVLLSSFHGVSMYLLLVPWLYYAGSFSRHWTPLPLALLLGLREDAFLLALPILLYVAARDRWTAGYVYAGAAVAYGLVAIYGLYPWITGRALAEVRATEVGGARLLAVFTPEGFRARRWALLFVVLPLLPLVRRGAWRAGVIALLPVAVSMASGFERQYQLRNHYPAAVMAGLVVGVVAALGSSAAERRPGLWHHPVVLAGLLLATTLWAHHAHGFLVFGARFHPRVGFPDPTGARILAVAAQIPKEGILLVPDGLGGAFGNRPDLLGWRQYDPARHDVRLVFCDRKATRDGPDPGCRRLLADGRFRTRYADDLYLVLEKVPLPAPTSPPLPANEPGRAAAGELEGSRHAPMTSGRPRP